MRSRATRSRWPKRSASLFFKCLIEAAAAKAEAEAAAQARREARAREKAEAEAKKRSMDLPENYARDVLQPFIENVALEVTRALQFFFTSTPYGRVDQIMLAGGCAVIDGLADVVANRAQTPTSIVNPFKGMEIDSDVREKQLRADAPALLTCTGLAMRRFIG